MENVPLSAKHVHNREDLFLLIAPYWWKYVQKMMCNGTDCQETRFSRHFHLAFEINLVILRSAGLNVGLRLNT